MMSWKFEWVRRSLIILWWWCQSVTYVTDLDPLYKACSQSVNILGVQRIGRFIQSKNAAVLTKWIWQCKAYDYRSQHFLACRTTSAHIHFHLIFSHHHLETYVRKIRTSATKQDAPYSCKNAYWHLPLHPTWSWFHQCLAKFWCTENWFIFKDSPVPW